MFAEAWARPLLILHAIVAVAAVGAATHAWLWLRRYVRTGARGRATRRFSTIAFGLTAATFVLGLIVYPTYRTRVRAEYLDDPVAITDAVRSELAARARAADLAEPDEATVLAQARARTDEAAAAVRWFDVKEFVALIGLLLAGGLALCLWAWEPAATPAIGRWVLRLALGSAACGWFAAVVGFLTAAWRAV